MTLPSLIIGLQSQFRIIGGFASPAVSLAEITPSCAIRVEGFLSMAIRMQSLKVRGGSLIFSASSEKALPVHRRKMTNPDRTKILLFHIFIISK